MRERTVTIILEEGHEQWVHNGHVKCPDAGEKNVELLVLAGAGGDEERSPARHQLVPIRKTT